MGTHRARVLRKCDEATSRYYLEGQETTSKRQANVFANAAFVPLCAARADKQISYEIQVKYDGLLVADDTPEDCADTFRYRLLTWRDTDAGPVSKPLIQWEDCNDRCGDEARYGRLLRCAVDRILSARYGGTPPPPRLVGAPPPVASPLPAALARDVFRRLSDIAAARDAGARERNLASKKKAVARVLVRATGLAERRALGPVAIHQVEAGFQTLPHPSHWSAARLDRAILDLRQGLALYRQELRKRAQS